MQLQSSGLLILCVFNILSNLKVSSVALPVGLFLATPVILFLLLIIIILILILTVAIVLILLDILFVIII